MQQDHIGTSLEGELNQKIPNTNSFNPKFMSGQKIRLLKMNPNKL